MNIPILGVLALIGFITAVLATVGRAAMIADANLVYLDDPIPLWPLKPGWFLAEYEAELADGTA